MIKSAGLRFREALRESNNNQKPLQILGGG